MLITNNYTVCVRWTIIGKEWCCKITYMIKHGEIKLYCHILWTTYNKLLHPQEKNSIYKIGK